VARLKRQELKHDEFIDSVDELYLYVEEHGRQLLSLALVILLGGAALGGLYWYDRQQEQKAGAALGAALITFEAPVQAGLPPLPGEGARKTFTSEKEKYEAAEKEFAAVRADFPRTRAARLARQYQAVCQWEKGEHDSALATLEELTRSSDRNASALAKFTLAGYYETLGRAADAEKLYRELIERPTTTVPKASAQLALADLKTSSDPAEARRLLEEVQEEFPDTAVAREVARRLELLPPVHGEPVQGEPAPAEPSQPKQP